MELKFYFFVKKNTNVKLVFQLDIMIKNYI